METGATARCLDDAEVAAYLLGALEQGRWAEVELHLDQCVACQKLLFAALETSPEPPPPGRLQKAASHTALTRLKTGDLVANKYRIQSRIGRGGMGEVYAALHVQLERRVAIKVMHNAGVDANSRFLREAQVCARLANEHVVRVFDLGELPSGEPYIVMEYLNGEDLSQVLRRGPVVIEEAVDYLRQACSALGEAHAAGVIHRDLKPANLFCCLRPDGSRVLKVLDFGISKYESHSSTAGTEQGALLGTPLYMSPEQFQSSHDVDERADIWSLGVVLFELLTGRTPFAPAQLPALAAAVSLQEVPRPSTFRSELSIELEQIVLRCLRRDRGKRFPSVVDLESALARFASGSPIIPDATLREEGVLQAMPNQAAQFHFTGRERELAQFRQLFARARHGSGTVVFVAGEAGIGKTALTGRVCRDAQLADLPWYVSSGRCLEHSGSSEPYMAFLDAIAGLMAGSRGQAVRALARRLAPSWCWQLPAFFESDAALAEIRQAVAGGSRERMLRELCELLTALTVEHPFLLVLEDLHWADPSSIDQLRLLSQRCAERSWLIVGTFRPQQLETQNAPLAKLRADLLGTGAATEMALMGFDRDELAAYLDARFSRHELPASFVELLGARTEGQPLFVARLLDLLEERRLLQRRDRVWRLTAAGAVPMEVPASLGLALQRTLDVLGSEERRTLQFASVQGAEFNSEVLRDALGEHLLELEERLARIEKSTGLVCAQGEDQSSPGRFFARYRFAHALYQEHLYAELTPSRRRELHRRAASTLLELYGAAKAPPLALGRHYEEAGDAVLASQYLLRAGEHAEKVFAYGEALQLCKRALSLLERMPLEERPPHFARLRERVAWIHYELRDFSATDSAFLELLRDGEQCGDFEMQIEALHGLCFSTLQSYRYGSVEPYVERALQLCTATSNQARRSEMLALRGVLLANLEQYEQSVGVLDESLAIAWRLNHRRALELGVDCLAYVHHRQGDYVRSEAQSRLALSLQLHPRVAIACTFRLGMALARLGRIAEGFSKIEAATELATRKSQTHSLLNFTTGQGLIFRELGCAERALALHRGVLPGLEQLSRCDGDRDPPLRSMHTRCLIQMALDLLCLDQPGPAAEALAQAEALRRDDTKSIRQGHPVGEHNADIELVRLELLLATGEIAHLLPMAVAARAEARRLAVYDEEARAAWLTIRILQRQGNINAALDAVPPLLDLLGRYPMPLLRWRVVALSSELQVAAGRKETATSLAYDAAQSLYAIAANISERELQQSFLETPEARRVFARAGGITRSEKYP